MEKEPKNNRRSSSKKKLLSECQKAFNRAERERARLMKEYEQEQERKRKIEEKEAKLREKQLKKEEEERLKEERRLKRLEEQKKREEEKEAERKRKEEEKRKKEEERLQKEQEKKKEEEFKTKREEKQRAVLLGFLVKGETKKDAPTPTTVSCGPFMQFQLRKDMRMAPLHRVSEIHLQEKRANLTRLLDDWRSDESEDTASALGLRKFGRTDYLHELRTKQHMPLSCPSTWPTEPPDVQFEGFCSALTSSVLKKHGCRGSGGTVWLRAKLFQFVENYRPAYYGTWRRRSHIVTGRRPFARDQLELDYTVDSDDEWEEEEPGESITQSDNEDEEEREGEDQEEDEEDDDDRFFVPHGYLSDDEGVAAEDADEDVAGGLGSEEMKRLRQRLSVVEYEAAHRRGLQRLKPLILGPIWLPEPIEISSATQLASESLRDLDEEKENVEFVSVHGTSTGLGVEKTELQLVRSALSIYRVHLWDTTVPIAVPLDAVVPPTPSNRRVKRGLPDEAIPYLIHLVHKSPLGKAKLAFEFRVFWHRHTTGKLPECTQYGEFKRCNAHALSAGAHRRGPVLSGPQWDNLALSQYVVLAKLAEIAVFEDGRWAVHPDVIRQFSQRLNAACGLTDSNVLRADADDTAIASYSFPPWQYLSDVANVTLRPNRVSAAARRRSLEIPCMDTEPDPAPVAPLPTSDTRLHADSPRVMLQQLSLATQEIKLKDFEVSPALKPSVASSVHDLTASNPTECVSVPDVPTTPSNVSGSRKRIKTLENFFTPPSSKRPHHVAEPSDLNSSEPIIVSDSD